MWECVPSVIGLVRRGFSHCSICIASLGSSVCIIGMDCSSFKRVWLVIERDEHC